MRSDKPENGISVVYKKLHFILSTNWEIKFILPQFLRDKNGLSAHFLRECEKMSWGETLPVNSISFHTPRLLLVCVCSQSCPPVCDPMDYIAYQAPLSMGFSRQEYWIGLSFPSLGDLPGPGIKSESLVSPALAGRFFTTVPHPKT